MQPAGLQTSARAGRAGALRGLAAACHPLPCLAVTGFAMVYGWSVGLHGARIGLLGAAVLAGQLSIGWCNDAVDAGRDAAAGRLAKPIPGGLVSRRVVVSACACAAAACVVLSLALGVPAGVVHLVAVASAWAYNLPLKSTWASPLPFALSFGLLVAVATLALPVPVWPPPAVMAAAGSLGVAAHFANTVGDAAADAATGVRGLPQRLGPRVSLVLTAAFVALAAGLLVGGVARRAWPGVVLLLCGAVLAAAGVWLGGRRATGRLAFRLTLVAVALVVVGFVA